MILHFNVFFHLFLKLLLLFTWKYSCELIVVLQYIFMLQYVHKYNWAQIRPLDQYNVLYINITFYVILVMALH